MAFTHTIGRTYKNDAGTLAAVTASYVGDAENDLSVSVPAATSNNEYDLAINLSKVVAMAIYSTAAVTLKTNSSAGSDTLVLAAKQLVEWTNDESGITAKPFTTDVTKFFISNTGAAAATVDIRILENV